ncbi:MAG: hypothetical protein ACE5IZ_00940 [Dehalococcoidia bacterium]
MRPSLADRLYKGFVGGFLGVNGMHWLGFHIRDFVYPGAPTHFHPALIARRIARALGREQDLTEQQIWSLGVLIHYWYGGFWGAVYGLIYDRIPLPSVLSGWLLAAFLWTIAFPGWIPAFGIAPPFYKLEKDDLLGTIAGHTGYGLATGLFVRALLGAGHKADSAAQ